MSPIITATKIIAAVGLIAVTAACGADPAGSAVAAEPVVELSELDVGAYRTEPVDMGLPKNMPAARFMEANRLASAMPLPYEVDPMLTVGEAGTTHSFLEVGQFHLSPIFHWLHEETFNDAAKDFIAGFSTIGRSDEERIFSYELVNSTLIFPDNESAEHAAAALSKAELYGAGPTEGSSLPEYPDAFAKWQPETQSLISWKASGQYVLITIVEHNENAELGISDLPFLTTLSQKSIAATVESLQEFTPTPVDRLMATPVDPDNIRGLSLERPLGDSFENIPGGFDLHGALHLADNPKEIAQLYRDNGVDRVVLGAGKLVRATDSGAAQRIFQAESRSDKFWHSVDPPTNLPNAKCLQHKGPRDRIRFYCHVQFERYVASEWSGQIRDAHQRISAQYSILANSK